MKHLIVYVHGKGGSADEAEHFLPPFSRKRDVDFSVFSVFCPRHVRKREILTSWLETAKTRSFRRGT